MQSARETARGNTCRNNIKQLQLALTSYDTQMKQAARLRERAVQSQRPERPALRLIPATDGRRASWIVMTFPHIEQPALWDEWSTKFGRQPARARHRNAHLPQRPARIFPASRGRNYVGNCRHGDSPISTVAAQRSKRDNAADGIFFDDNKNREFRAQRDDREADPRIEMSLGSSRRRHQQDDHALREHARLVLVATDATSDETSYQSTIQSMTKHLFGFVWKNVVPRQAQPSTIERINGDRYYDQADPPVAPASMDALRPTCRLTSSYGFPHSTHPGGVNMAFCDGHVDVHRRNDGPARLRPAHDVQPQPLELTTTINDVRAQLTPPADNAY